MANNVHIVINETPRKVVDMGKLGLKISSEVDDFKNLMTANGLRIDNAIRRVVAAGTNEDTQAAGHSGIIGADIEEAKAQQAAYIDVAGLQLFSGKARLDSTLRNRNGVENFTYVLQSGAAGFFSDLGKRLLTSFDLGTTLYSTENFLASYDGTYAQGYPATFAPVVYGTEEADLESLNIRPHVKFPAIVKPIINELGWTLSSEFFDTTYFENHHYMFGVGDQWRVSGGENIIVLANVDTATAYTNDNTPGEVHFEDIDSDESNDESSWNGNTWTSPEDGEYNFRVSLSRDFNSFSAVYTVNLVLAGGVTISIPSNAPIFDSGFINVPGGEQVKIEITVSSGTVTYLPDSYLKITKYEEVALGGLIDVASCLHSNPAKDFFDAITFMFCLVWYAHEPTKTLYVEPRFDYTLDDVTYEGFYKGHSTEDSDLRPEDWSSKIDQDGIVIESIKMFSDAAIFKNKAEGTNVYERTAARGTSSIPFLAARCDFGDYGLGDKTLENPYFEDMLAVGNGELSGGYGIPLILAEDYDEGLWDGAERNLPTATYESNPKYGYYHGNFSYGGWWLDGEFYSTTPLITQRPADSSSAFDEVIYSATFSDFIDPGGSSKIAAGYLSLFYRQFLAIVKDGQLIKARVSLSLKDFATLDHRSLKIGRIGGTSASLLLLKVKQFDPVNPAKTECTFLTIPGIINIDAAISHNTQSNSTQFPP